MSYLYRIDNDPHRENAYEVLYDKLDREPSDGEIQDYIDSLEAYYCFAGSDGFISLERKQ